LFGVLIMLNLQECIDAWNVEADGGNQWDDLDTDEKCEWCLGRANQIIKAQTDVQGGINMDLISCDRCGVVLDKDKITFPSIYNHDTQEVIYENAEWDGYKYVSKINCPVCEEIILSN
jgi:hypothetical protein